jgi:hypothetical protein
MQKSDGRGIEPRSPAWLAGASAGNASIAYRESAILAAAHIAHEVEP